jgi:hypothetical protein
VHPGSLTQCPWIPLYAERQFENRDIVSAEHPDMIPNLVQLSLWLIKSDRYGLVRITLHQFSVMSRQLRPRNCHIYRMLAEYSKLESSVCVKVASRAWRHIVDRF